MAVAVVLPAAEGEEGVIEGGERGVGCFISRFVIVGCCCAGEGERGSTERTAGSIDVSCVGCCCCGGSEGEEVMMDNTGSEAGAGAESVLGGTITVPCVCVVPVEVVVVALATAPGFVAPAAAAELAAAFCLSTLLSSPEKVMMEGEGWGGEYKLLNQERCKCVSV